MGRLEQRWESRREAGRERERRSPSFDPSRRQDRPLEGRHPRLDSLGVSERSQRRHRWGLGLTSVAFACQTALGIVTERYGYAALAATMVVLVWVVGRRTTRSHTTVAPDALRVQGVVRQVTIPWGRISSVAETSAWSPTQTVMLTTDEGKQLRTDVPDSLREEFVSYARAHGMHGASDQTSPEAK